MHARHSRIFLSEIFGSLKAAEGPLDPMAAAFLRVPSFSQGLPAIPSASQIQSWLSAHQEQNGHTPLAQLAASILLPPHHSLGGIAHSNLQRKSQQLISKYSPHCCCLLQAKQCGIAVRLTSKLSQLANPTDDPPLAHCSLCDFKGLLGRR